MENTDTIKHFKEVYSQNNPPRHPRLPCTIHTLDETKYRLMATYELEVEYRERNVVWNNSTKSKIDKASNWIFSSTKRGLILMGTCGNGKSTMLRAIKRMLASHATYCHADEIHEYCKKTQGDIMYKNERFLLLDDLGAEPEKCISFGEELYPMVKLLSHRYNYMLTTIIATNLGLDQIRERYGARVADRLTEMFDVIVYSEESFRGRKDKAHER